MDRNTELPFLRSVLTCALLAAAGAADAACIPWSAYHFAPNEVTEVEVQASPLTDMTVQDQQQWRAKLRVNEQIAGWLQASVAAGCPQIVSLTAVGDIGRYVREPEQTHAGGRYRALERLTLTRDGQSTTIDSWASANKAASGPSRALLTHEHEQLLDPVLSASLAKGNLLYVDSKITLAAGLARVTDGADRVVVSYEWQGPPVLVIYMPEPAASLPG